MKKLLVSLLAACMVFAVAGTASAWTSNDLTLVIYNEDGNEMGFNLGTVFGDGAMDLGASATLLEAGSFNLADVAAGDGPINVGLFAASEGAAGMGGFLAGSADGVVDLNVTGAMGFIALANDVANAYESGNPITAGILGSYDQKLNLNSGAPGTYGGAFYATEGILVEDGFVDMTLSVYNWSDLTETAVVRVFADGSVVLNPVPVPGALILMGSGLLGLAGIRRKK